MQTTASPMAGCGGEVEEARIAIKKVSDQVANNQGTSCQPNTRPIASQGSVSRFA